MTPQPTPSRRWPASVTLAAVTGLFSGIARAITGFILDQMTAG